MQTVPFSFRDNHPGYSGCDTLESEVIAGYGIAYAICFQPDEKDRIQVIMMEGENFDPLDSVSVNTLAEVEKWLNQRGVSIAKDDEYLQFEICLTQFLR